MTSPIDLSTAANFVILGNTMVIFNGSLTKVYGNIGMSPNDNISGSGYTQLSGITHLNNEAAVKAQKHLGQAITQGQGLSYITIPSELGNLTYTAGQYSTNSGFNIAPGNTLTLSGPGYFIFYCPFSTLTTNIGSNVILINGAVANNIYWLVGGSATINGTNIYGNILALTDINMGNNADIVGRTLSKNGSVIFDGNNNAANSAPCFLKGTKILTLQGYIPIENLNIGDDVIVKGIISSDYSLESTNTTSQKVKWIGHFSTSNLNNDCIPICISKNAFGENKPNTNIYISPHHSVLIDNKFISAKNLVNEKTIYRDFSIKFVEYYHIETEQHSVVDADGLLSESFIDSSWAFKKKSFTDNNKLITEVVPVC
jgi:antigen 43